MWWNKVVNEKVLYILIVKNRLKDIELVWIN